MADAAKLRSDSAGWDNESKTIRGVYNFADDGGAQGDFNLITFDGDVIVTSFYLHVTTAFAGATSAYQAGIDGGTEVAPNTAVGSMTADAVIAQTQAPFRVASGSQLTFSIDTADATAGACEVVVECKRAR